MKAGRSPMDGRGTHRIEEGLRLVRVPSQFHPGVPHFSVRMCVRAGALQESMTSGQLTALFVSHSGEEPSVEYLYRIQVRRKRLCEPTRPSFRARVRVRKIGDATLFPDLQTGLHRRCSLRDLVREV